MNKKAIFILGIMFFAAISYAQDRKETKYLRDWIESNTQMSYDKGDSEQTVNVKELFQDVYTSIPKNILKGLFEQNVTFYNTNIDSLNICAIELDIKKHQTVDSALLAIKLIKETDHLDYEGKCIISHGSHTNLYVIEIVVSKKTMSYNHFLYILEHELLHAYLDLYETTLSQKEEEMLCLLLSNKFERIARKGYVLSTTINNYQQTKELELQKMKEKSLLAIIKHREQELLYKDSAIVYLETSIEYLKIINKEVIEQVKKDSLISLHDKYFELTTIAVLQDQKHKIEREILELKMLDIEHDFKKFPESWEETNLGFEYYIFAQTYFAKSLLYTKKLSEKNAEYLWGDAYTNPGEHYKNMTKKIIRNLYIPVMLKPQINIKKINLAFILKE